MCVCGGRGGPLVCGLRSRAAFRQPKRSLKQNEMNKCMRTSVYLEQAKGCPPFLLCGDVWERGGGKEGGGGYPLGVEERWQQSSPNGQLNVL